MRKTFALLLVLAIVAAGGLGFFAVSARLTTPQHVVLRSYEYVRRGDLARLEGCYTEDAWAIIRPSLPATGDQVALANLDRYMGRLGNVEVTSTEVRGAHADVETSYVIAGALERERFRLAQIDGEWRIDCGVRAEGDTVDRLIEGCEARLTYSFANRAILQGQAGAAPDGDPYGILVGDTRVLQGSAEGEYDARFGADVLLRAAGALLDDPQRVTVGLGRALIRAGVQEFLVAHAVYRAWNDGVQLDAAQRRDLRRHADALEKVRLGRDLIAQAADYHQSPAGWAERRAELAGRLDQLRQTHAAADALEVLAVVQPIIAEAWEGIDDYPPYRRHRDKLRASLSEGTTALADAIVRAHARVMAPGANMRRTNHYPGKAVRDFSEVWWTHDAGNPVRGQPAVGSSTLYYAAAGRYRWDPLRVYAIGLPGREPKWSFEAPARRGYSLTLHGTRLYLACGDVGSTPSYLCSLEAATGKPRWVFEGPNGEENTLSHPAIGDGMVLVADRWGTLFALDAETGKERWSLEVEAGRRSTAPTPALDEGVAYLATTHYVIAVEAATGEELWRTDASIGEGVLAVEGDAMYFCDGGLSAVSLDDRRYLWEFEPPAGAPLRGGPAVAGELVIARDAGNLYAIDRESGRLRWIFTSEQPFDWKVSPVVAGGVVYVGTEGSQTSDGGNGAYLYAIDAARGTKLWDVQVQTSLYGAPPVVSDGVVYFSSENELYAVH